MLRMSRKNVDPDIVILELAGRLNEEQDRREIASHVNGLLRESRRKLVLDLSRMDQLDSMGVGTIVMCSAKLRKSAGEMRIAGAHGVVEELLKLTRVDQTCGFYTSATAAAQGFILPET